jgi:hypothetical protein
LLLGAVACGALGLAQARAGDSAFTRRVEAGCEELEPCRTLVAEAERRMDECTFFCSGAAAGFRDARTQLHRAEERQAVRDHYRERERTERESRESLRAQKLDAWQRREKTRAEVAEREHRERLELERLRQDHADQRRLEERARRAHYFTSLGPEGRDKRLKRCLALGERCDGLALELVEAATDDAEKRSLGELNEGVTHEARRAEPEPRLEEARRSRNAPAFAGEAPEDVLPVSAPSS